MRETFTLLTRKEAALDLNLSLRTVDSLISKGDLPIVQIGKSVRIRRECIAALIEARETRRKPSNKTKTG